MTDWHDARYPWNCICGKGHEQRIWTGKWWHYVGRSHGDDRWEGPPMQLKGRCFDPVDLALIRLADLPYAR